MMDERQAELEAHMAAFAEASEPILAELAESGVEVERLSQLIKEPIDYRPGISVLLKWLPLVDNLAVKRTLVQVLTVKWARPVAAHPLIEEYLKVPIDTVDDMSMLFKWEIGSALSVVADASVFDEVVALVRDRRHGWARQMLAVALGNMKDPRVVGVLIDLLDDEEVAGHALVALRKLAPVEARGAIERFVDHPKTWVRNEARRAVAKIDKKIAREAEKRATRGR